MSDEANQTLLDAVIQLEAATEKLAALNRREMAKWLIAVLGESGEPLPPSAVRH